MALATPGQRSERLLESKLAHPRSFMTAFGNIDLLCKPPSRRNECVVAKDIYCQSRLLNRGEKLPNHYNCPIAVWQFGNDLTLVGLPGEVVVDYVALLEKALGPLKLWPIAYCNDVFGYLPSARVLAEGGYETRGLYSGTPGLFSPAAQDAIILKVRELATQAGRQMK